MCYSVNINILKKKATFVLKIELSINVFIVSNVFSQYRCFLSDTRGIYTELKEHIVILLPIVISFEPQKATENLKKHVSATRKQ